MASQANRLVAPYKSADTPLRKLRLAPENGPVRKDTAAVSLARRRWKNTTASERSEHARMMNEAKLDAIPPGKRKAIASNAAKARWAKVKAEKALRKKAGKNVGKKTK